MLYSLLYPLHEIYASLSFLNVFKYISFRTLGAALTALFLSLTLGERYIRWLKAKQIGQSIRDDGPQSHLSKKGTPTMGGALIIVTVVISTLLWSDLSNQYIWLCLFNFLGVGVVGWVDDYRKVVLKNSKGLSGRSKLFWIGLIALLFSVYVYFLKNVDTSIRFPFFKNALVDLRLFYIPFAMFVLMGSSNAVNLTDGLDGLAIGPVIIAATTYLIFAYVCGHSQLAEYLQIPHVPGVGELSVFCGSIAAAGMGFLWFNAYPAQVFMGDVGALALGSALGSVAILTKNEILLVIIGGIFVAEAVSVMLQVFSYKTRKKRIFKMAPLHHHFELKGWPEPKVIVRFWILSIILALVALSTLKLR